MTDERLSEIMEWPAFLKIEQCGPNHFVTRVKKLVKIAEREEQDRITKFDPRMHADAGRVLAWLSDKNRKPANLAFTDGLERQLAYRFEDAFSQISELELRVKEANQLSDVAVPLCHEHQDKIADLERQLASARGEK